MSGRVAPRHFAPVAPEHRDRGAAMLIAVMVDHRHRRDRQLGRSHGHPVDPGRW